MNPQHISQETITDLKEIFFPTCKGGGLGDHAVKFLLESPAGSYNVDMATLCGFVAYLKKKGYS